ncbi:MAG: MFS transporter [Prevotella sp.]|nr:MFS transporter [Prevotella sp.]
MKKATKFRWVICTMLFLATLVNYMDRQVLSLTWKDFIAVDFHWNDNDYGNITAIFSIFYAIISLFAGRVIDWLGTKKGYVLAIFVWSLGACMHAACGIATLKLTGIPDMDALRAVQAGSQTALMVSTISVWLFLGCRIVLACGEAGNFPSAVKVTAEYFPKKDRAYATSIFNSGASIGALVAPLIIPVLANVLGWEAAFLIIGGIGFLWAGAWLFLYDAPRKSRFVNKEELAYIESDKDEEAADAKADAEEENGIKLSFIDCFKYRQTWAFIVGKLLTDGVWWFYLFWAPAYFSELGHPATTFMGQMLIFVLYLIVTVISIYGGYLPRLFVDKRGMDPYAGRMRAMLIFAFLPLFAMFAQPLAGYSVWWPCVLIGLAGAGHQAWSANLYSTIGDMFPKSAIATITGIGTMFGGLCSFAINKCSGMLFTFAEQQGDAFTFFGSHGKPAGYMIVFCYCAIAYLLAWVIMKALVPRYKKIG